MTTYSNTWDDAYPDGDTEDASALDNIIRRVQLAVKERLEDILGVDFDDDPLLVTKLGAAIVVGIKNAYLPFYDAGNSGSAKTLALVNNGPNQKLTLNNNCTLTIAVPPEGTSGTIALIQDATGGRTVTWPANWNFASNIAPVILTNPSSIALYPYVSVNGVVLIMNSGSNFDSV